MQRSSLIRSAAAVLAVCALLSMLMLHGCSGSGKVPENTPPAVSDSAASDETADSNAAGAASDDEGGLSVADYEYKEGENGTLILTGYTGSSSAPVIPTEIDGRMVTALDGTFTKNNNITDITVPEGIVSIGGFTFNKCMKLTRVVLPDSLTEIQNQAFGGCVLLEDINFPSGSLMIGPGAFDSCQRLRSLTLTGDMSIGQRAFNNSGLAEIVITEDVRKIDESAFESCKSLESIHIPGNVKVLDNCAFMGCDHLSSVTLDEGVYRIEGYVFAGCTSLKELRLPESMGEVGPGAFHGCNIKIRALCDGAYYHGWGAFDNIKQYYCDGDGSIEWEYGRFDD